MMSLNTERVAPLITADPALLLSPMSLSKALMSKRASAQMPETLAIHKAMEKIGSWDFDVFEVNALTNVRILGSVCVPCCFLSLASVQNHALYLVITTLAEAHNVFAGMGIDDMVFRRLVLEIEKGYCGDNPYHNLIHAADVVQSTAFFLSQPILITQITKLDTLAALLAAAVHDYRHPGTSYCMWFSASRVICVASAGVNNAFLAAIGDELALTYNDNAVLENMHVAEFFRLMKHDKCVLSLCSRSVILGICPNGG
jgi:hypothetical protein